MDGKKRRLSIRIIKLLPFAGIAIFLIAYLVVGRDISIETLLHYTPKNVYLGAMFLLLLYAAKSLSVFFPMDILEVAGGIIFPTGFAIIINIVGNAIDFSIPYFIGSFIGPDITNYLIKKQPKLQVLYQKQKHNEWFLSFFLRAIACLPGDLVSMYLGTQNIRYFVFLSGSVVGSVFGILATTIIGANILNPTSPAFIISASIKIIIALTSLAFHHFWRKKSASD